MADRPLRPATDRWLGRLLPHQLPNLISAAPIARGLAIPRFHPQVVCGISCSFEQLSPTTGHVPIYYSPVRHSSASSSPRRDHSDLLPFDLHVLGLPPTFNLSHDQTLQFKKVLAFSKAFRSKSVSDAMMLESFTQNELRVPTRMACLYFATTSYRNA